MKVITKSAAETKKFAKEMAAKIDRLAAYRTRQRAIIVGLQGELGSGKTTFVQGFLEYFGIGRATSPTFVIIKKYNVKNSKSKILNPKQILPSSGGIRHGQTNSPPTADPPQAEKFKIQNIKLYHIDCYRIKNYRDLLDLGFEEMINNPDTIVLIEWAEKIRDILSKDAIWVKFWHKSEQERIVEIFNFQ